MSRFEFLSLLISLLAASISAYALFRGHRLGRRQAELQAEQAKLAAFQHKLLVRKQQQRAKADIRAAIVKYDKNFRLVVENVGSSPARNLRVTPVDIPGTENALTRSDVEDIFPVPELRPGEDVSLRLFVHLGTKFPFDAIFTWDDESGENQQRQLRLGL